MHKRVKAETLCAHAGEMKKSAGPLVPGIFPSTTFVRDSDYALPVDDEGRARMYLRDDHDNAQMAEKLLAQIENASEARLFASGLSAAAAVFSSTLNPGDAVVASGVMYFGVRKWLRDFTSRFGMKLVLVDGTETQQVRAAIADVKPKVVWIETPGNPTLDVVDIAATADASRAVGALLCVDNTAATPVHTRPIDLGADIVMHSATKYLNGHSDVLAGALCTSSSSSSAWGAIKQHRHDQGALPGAFESWLLLRGMRTLFLRVPRQSANAAAVAEFLVARDDVEAALYPGLSCHKNHKVARAQMLDGFGALVSVRVKPSSSLSGEQRALAVAKKLNVFARATSLGGVESLVEHRGSVEGPDSPTPKDLLRLSIGIEHADDLVDDLAQALDATR